MPREMMTDQDAAKEMAENLTARAALTAINQIALSKIAGRRMTPETEQWAVIPKIADAGLNATITWEEVEE